VELVRLSCRNGAFSHVLDDFDIRKTYLGLRLGRAGQLYILPCSNLDRHERCKHRVFPGYTTERPCMELPFNQSPQFRRGFPVNLRKTPTSTDPRKTTPQFHHCRQVGLMINRYSNCTCLKRPRDASHCYCPVLFIPKKHGRHDPDWPCIVHNIDRPCVTEMPLERMYK
jgi:hypothetical protein